jgi:nuclear pore complex protein Nup155
MSGEFSDLKLNARCDLDTQKLVTSMTFEDLITTQNGVTAARALVNVVIDQQIGQQISVRNYCDVLCNEVINFV